MAFISTTGIKSERQKLASGIVTVHVIRNGAVDIYVHGHTPCYLRLSGKEADKVCELLKDATNK